MSKTKSKRPGTKTGATRRATIPDDLPNAAVAALDDLLISTEPSVVSERKRNPFDTSESPTVSRKDIPPPKKKREPTAAPLDDSQILEELPKASTLRFAIYEEAAHLAAAQSAVVSCGHVVSAGASGAPGATRVVEAIRRGGIDVVIVGMGARGGAAGAVAPGAADDLATGVIDAALALEPRRPVVIAAFAGDATSAVSRALAVGADLATTRPHDVERLAPVALAAARLHAERVSSAAARGNEQVLRARLEDLADAEPGGLQPFELFQRQLETEIKRAQRYEYALSVALFAVEVEGNATAGIKGIVRARVGNALINCIRDIDLATQLDHERFLVLLPYTDLTGATVIGRRVIAAVGALDPVSSAGRTFQPKVVGAVAGSKPGKGLSFAKLMKDATRALEQARKDGAELAVQP